MEIKIMARIKNEGCLVVSQKKQSRLGHGDGLRWERSFY